MAARKDDFSFSFSEHSNQHSPEEGAPSAQAGETSDQFRILILADLSGRTNRQVLEGSGAVAARKVQNIDADSFDRALARINPQIHLPVSDTSVVKLSFKTLDDFRPDALLQRVEVFQALMKLRAALLDPHTYPEAAAKVRALAGAGSAPPQRPVAPPSSPQSDDDFAQLLDRSVAPKGDTSAADALIANLVAGSGVPEADPDQARLVQFIEDALSAGLRAVLRHPAFQAVESAWRAVAFLTSRLNTDEALRLSVLDISRDELQADLTGAAALRQTALYRLLVEQTRAPGARPFSLVIGDYEFGPSTQDVALLAKIAELMGQAAIPFVAGASPAIPGFPSFHEPPDPARWQPPADIATWEKIRAHPQAAHIALAAPRFLLRLPYGPDTDAIDAYPFDEMPGRPLHPAYLWGNGAFAVAYVMGQAFLEEGWGFSPGNDVSDLPCHMALVDGDREMTPCAEGWLSDRLGDILHNLGLIPLLSVRHSAALKVAGVHSIAQGGAPLAASWA